MEIENFLIFNKNFGDLHNEDSDSDEHILFFYPSNTNKNNKLQLVGLALALINFTIAVGDDQCEITNSDKSTFIFTQPEENYWIVIRLTKSISTVVNRLFSLKNLTNSAINGDSSTESISNHNVLLVLKRANDNFQLLHHSMEYIFKTHSLKTLRTCLYNFYTTFLDQLDVNSIDLLYAINGIDYLSLKKQTHSSILTFTTELETRYPYPFVQSSLLLWKHHLVWSGESEFTDIKPLYDYLTNPNTGKFADDVINQVKAKDEPVISGKQVNLTPTLIHANTSSSTVIKSSVAKFSGFLVGPTSSTLTTIKNTPLTTANQALMIKETTIFIGKEKKEVGLVIYQHREDCTVVLLMEKGGDGKNIKFFQDLVLFLEDRLMSLNGLISQEWEHTRKLRDQNDQQCRYIYYNGMNLAIKTSIGNQKNTIVTAEMISALNQINEYFMSCSDTTMEIQLKSLKEFTVCGKKENSKVIYLIIPTKADIYLLDINKELSKLSLDHMFL